jgi:hypothetical protein
VGEGLGVRAKKHKHLVCVYGAVVYIYETAGYIYGAIVEFLGAGRSIHGVCAG